MKTPELHTQLRLGDRSVYVVEVEVEYDGRTAITAHDDNGDEVEIRFLADDEEEDEN